MAKFQISIEIGGNDEKNVREAAVKALASLATQEKFEHGGNATNPACNNGLAYSISYSTLSGRIQAAERHLSAMRDEMKAEQ